MLCTDMMPRSANAPLKQGECVLNGVRVRVSHDIDSFRVIDRLMFSGRHASSLDRGGIGRIIISKDHFRIFADVFADVLSECFGLHVFGMKQSKFAIALTNPNDDFLVFWASRFVSLAADV